jgi:hypothetical protein
MQYYLQLNNPGSGNLSVHRYSAGSSELSIGKLIKVNYRGQERGGWFIENISYDEVKSGEHAGEWKNVTGRGAMAVLADGIVYPETGSEESTRVFTNVTMASMLLTFIAEAKARGCFPDLRTDFSALLDSNSEPWTDLSTLSFNVDTSLLDVINQFVDLGLEFYFKLDWIVGDYVLYAYETAIGSDVSASVVFRPGLNCAEVNNKQESGELKNALRVTFNGGATEITDAASIAAYRRREAPFQVGNVTTSGGAVQMATPELTAKKDPQLSISIKVEDAANNPRAFVDYKVGDWVGYDAGDGAVPALYRVRGMMLDFGENDKYAAITVDLNSIRLERELQTAIALRKLGSGVIGASTSSPMPEGVAAAISAHNTDNTSHATRTLSGGDLSGTIGIPTVAKLRGRALKNPLTLSDKHLLKWSHANQQFEPGFVDWLEIESKPSTFEPSAHGGNHASGGSDEVKLDDLAAPDDNTDLDASTSKHGLMKKFPGGTTDFLRADGSFATPPGGGAGSGDVVGPSSSADGHLAVFDGLTGKLIKDGGAVPAGGGDVYGAASVTDGHLAVFDTDGYHLKDGGPVPAGEGVSGAVLVTTKTATGASPHSLATTDIQEGDVIVAAMTTHNSVAGSITGGSAWNELWYEDVSSDEEVRVFWKVAGASEPASYSWSHSAGALAASAIAVYRNLTGTLVHYGDSISRFSPTILGSAEGLHILVMQCCYQAASNLVLTDALGLVDIDVNYNNGDQAILIGSRDARFPAAQPAFGFTGGNSAYVVAGAIVIE